MKYLKVKREKSTTDKGHYVRNADLLPAVIEAKGLGYVTSKLSNMFFMIADRYSRKHNFIKYSFREDMVASAVANLCQNALKFNHEKYNNPFAYYTTAIHNSFLQFLNDEKRERDVRDKLLMEAGSNPSFNFLQGEKDESHFENLDSDDRSYSIDPELPEYDPDAEPTTVDNPIEGQNGEVKVQHISKLPGTVTRYGAGDYEVCPNTGNFILRKKEPVVEDQPKAKPKKVVATVEKPAVKKAAAVKKTVEKPAAKKAVAVKKAAPAVKKTPAAVKKTPAKPVAPKKTAAVKKTVEKKTPVKKEVVTKPKKITKGK